MKNPFKLLFFLLFSFCIVFLFKVDTIQAASNPYDVPSDVQKNWDNIKGSKNHTSKTGKKLIYDIYSKKFIRGGYEIVNKNFGKGNQPYLHFEGWSALFGHAKHTYSNNETYIVARKVGSNTTKIYATHKKRRLSATKDLEYNKQSESGLFNECPSNARNKVNTECNMRYNNVDFQAYIPLKELFTNPEEKAKWRLFIVKKVNGHIVYDELRLPFNFNNLTYLGGDISLSSGVDANKLTMNNGGVLRRRYASQTAYSVYQELGNDRYFTPGRRYAMRRSIEENTAVFYGVESPKDNNKIKYASSAYWLFGGDQATLTFDPDNDPPVHKQAGISNHRYKDGNTYWAQPNDDVTIRLRGYDHDSFIDRIYLGLRGNNIDPRVRHDWNNSNDTNIDYYRGNTNHVDYTHAARTYQSTDKKFREVSFTTSSKTHGHMYDIRYLYRDNALNYSNNNSFEDTGLQLGIDGVEPKHVKHTISGSKYKNRNTHWVNSNDNVKITFEQEDSHSGNKYQYLRLYGSNQDVRSRHEFSKEKNYLGSVSNGFNSKNVVIDSASRIKNDVHGVVEWNVIPKTHGHIYKLMYYYMDNAENRTSTDNSSSYGDTKLLLGVDDEGPIIKYRNKSDTREFTSRNWHQSNVNVRLKFKDLESGYKRSRYAWSKSSKTPNELSKIWSKWTTSSNYLTTQHDFGEWYLHVQAEDNVGNISTNKEGLYKINKPPIADFDYPDPSFEGDTLNLINKSKDPENHKMTAEWEITTPNDEIKYFTSWNVFLSNALPGIYKAKLIVTDQYGAKDEIIKNISITPLIIEGTVNHTERWENIHQKLGNPPNVFFSGERFMLEASVTDYPLSKVDVTFIGKDIKDNTVKLNTTLSKDHSNKRVIIYTGDIYEEFMSRPKTKLKNQTTVNFIFQATWENGVSKKDIVSVKIIDDVYDFYKLHRTE